MSDASTELVSCRAALAAAARYFDRPAAPNVLFAGIPDGEDAAELITHALERIGLTVSEVAKPWNRLDEAPLIVEFIDGMFDFLPDGPKTAGVSTGVGESLKRAYAIGLFYENNTTRLDQREEGPIERSHWLLGPMREVWRSYFGIAVAAMFINMLALASPIFTMNVYDRILPNKATSSLLALAVGVGLAMVFDLLLKSARARIIDSTGRKLDQKISYRIFDKVLHSSLSERTSSTGEYASRLSQVDFVREFFTSNTIATMIDAFFVFIFLAVIYLVAGWIAIIPAIAFILALAVGLVAQYRIGRRVARAANESALRQSMLVEAISTLETIKSLRAEGHLLKNWSQLTRASSHTAEDIKRISADATNFTQFVQQIVTVFVIIAGAYRFSLGEMSSGGIIAAVMLSGRTVAPLSQIAMTLARFKQALLSLRILDTIMKQKEDRPLTAGFVNRSIKNGSFAFDGVSFSYPGSDAKVLSNINLSVKKGERVGIIGRIGSGKTTFGRLLAGIYPSTEGRILLDGIDIKQFHPAEARSAVALAGQTVDLFSGTLKQNLLYAAPNATDDEIISAARRTGVDEFASEHPRGYDMIVGERGSSLSGGQKQAVAMTRLLLTEPKIVFLDEPSGALDLATERKLIGSLAKAFGPDVTLVISTHRYSLLELVDRLIVLDRGQIVADGPKDKVMAGLAERARQAQANQSQHSGNGP